MNSQLDTIRAALRYWQRSLRKGELYVPGDLLDIAREHGRALNPQELEELIGLMELKDPIGILRRVAKDAPVGHLSGSSYTQCTRCGAYFESGLDEPNPKEHDQGCPWRLAREFVDALAKLEEAPQ